MLPGVDRAGLWRVCYGQPDAPGLETVDNPASQTSGSAVQLLSTDTSKNTAVVNGGDDASVATDAPAASVAAAPRRAGVVDEKDNSDRLTNVSQIVSNIREDLANNLPFSKSSAEGCTDDVSSFYSDVWGQNFDDRLQAVRALTLAFAFCGALKILSLICCNVCCGGGGGGGGGRVSLGWLATIQVLAGWAGWLVFLWILMDISRNQSAHEMAKKAGIQIDTTAAKRVESYWGYPFWMFLASTILTTIDTMFMCCPPVL